MNEDDSTVLGELDNEECTIEITDILKVDDLRQ